MVMENTKPNKNVQPFNDTGTGKSKCIGKSKPQNIWSEIRSDYEDEGFIYIDAYDTPDENESGTVIAKVRISDNHVIYLDERAKTDKYAQEVITECFNRL